MKIFSRERILLHFYVISELAAVVEALALLSELEKIIDFRVALSIRSAANSRFAIACKKHLKIVNISRKIP